MLGARLIDKNLISPFIHVCEEKAHHYIFYSGLVDKLKRGCDTRIILHKTRSEACKLASNMARAMQIDCQGTTDLFALKIFKSPRRRTC